MENKRGIKLLAVLILLGLIPDVLSLFPAVHKLLDDYPFRFSWQVTKLFFFITSILIGIVTGYSFYLSRFLVRLLIVIATILVDTLVHVIYYLALSGWPSIVVDSFSSSLLMAVLIVRFFVGVSVLPLTTLATRALKRDAIK